MRYIMPLICAFAAGCQLQVYNRSVVKNLDQNAEMLGTINNTDWENDDSVEADKKNDVKTKVKSDNSKPEEKQK